MKSLKVLSPQEIDEKRRLLSPIWKYEKERLCLTIKCSHFDAAMALINAIADLARAQNHHPKIENEYDRVSLTLWTHDCGGITQRDFDLAQAIDALLEVPS